jgi:hypothetical protein
VWLVSLAGLSALALAVGASGGCAGKTSSSGYGTTQPASASQIVGPSGGIVSTSDGNLSVQIPAGALSSDVTVTIDPLTAVTVPARQIIGTPYELGPSGTTFAKPVTLTFAFGYPLVVGAAGDSAGDLKIMTSSEGSTFAALPTTVVDGRHASAPTTHFSTFVATVPGGGATGPNDGGSADTGSVVPPSGSNCIVQCEGPENIDGGIGCDCSVTCNGIFYDLQCVCGACTCYQDGVAGPTASLSVSACDFGAMSLMTTYFNTCGYPGAKNAGGGGGPTSNDAGGTCQ